MDQLGPACHGPSTAGHWRRAGDSFVAEANKAIRCLIILAHVICADETPIRAGPGPKSRMRYLLVACTHLLTYYFLGDRSMRTFGAFVLPDMDGAVVVHDRYQNYDAIPGLIHQLCCQHLLRDLEDTAQTYQDAHGPTQITQALTDSPGRMEPRMPAFVQFIRRQPSTYARVWLAAAAMALVIIAGGSVVHAVTGRPWPSMWFVGVGTIVVGFGLTQSYALNRRRNKIS